MNNKVAINICLSTVTLNANGLTAPIKNIWWLNRQENKALVDAVYKRFASDKKTHTD